MLQVTRLSAFGAPPLYLITLVTIFPCLLPIPPRIANSLFPPAILACVSTASLWLAVQSSAVRACRNSSSPASVRIDGKQQAKARSIFARAKKSPSKSRSARPSWLRRKRFRSMCFTRTTMLSPSTSPAGMTVHAGSGNVSGTLVNALLGRGQSLSQAGDPLRPGIVHRLDKETSGVILVAKNDAAHAKLGEAFRQRAIKKTYIALVQGILGEKSGRIELAIGRDTPSTVRA